MATAKQIETNQRKARTSTRPRTQAGRARARLNALKPGNRAQAVVPVLPQEELKEPAERIHQWTDDFQPRNAIERDLVARAARLSWVLDRTEGAETADFESFSSGDELERLHRFQTARHRELMQTLEMLLKLRRLDPAEKRPAEDPAIEADGAKPATYQNPEPEIMSEVLAIFAIPGNAERSHGGRGRVQPDRGVATAIDRPWIAPGRPVCPPSPVRTPARFAQS
jgi:hypothetical protein